MKHSIARRTFIKGLAAAGLAGCDGDAGLYIPYAEQPEGLLPGLPRYYATAVDFQGYAQPVLAETHMGRPTKLEGNPDSDWAAGATNAFTQAACAMLYHPERNRPIRHNGKVEDRTALEQELARLSGPGLRILTGTITSPSMARQLGRLAEAGMRWHVHEPVASANLTQASRLAFGRVLHTHVRLDRAGAIISVDADLLGPGPDQVRLVRQYSEARRTGIPRLLVAEPTLSLTGAAAERRLAITARRLPLLVQAISAELGVASRHPALGDDEAAWVAAAVQALTAHAGRSVLAGGPGLPVESLATIHSVNHALGNFGRIVQHTDPVALTPPDGEDSLAALVRDMRAGAVKALLILDSNPVFTAPADLDFAQALNQVAVKIHAGLFEDETAAACDWRLPLAHALEEWTDLRAPDGTATIVQPVIEPVFGALRRHEIMAAALGDTGAEARLIVQDTWRKLLGEPFEPVWRRVLHQGVVPDTHAATLRVTPDATRITAAAPPAKPGIELVFRPDPTLWDGRFAPLPWLQELPKPLTKLVWDGVFGISSVLAARLGISDGDMVEIAAGDRTLAAPALVLSGQADDCVTLYLGHGHRSAPPGATGPNVYPLRPAASPWSRDGATIRRTGAHMSLAITQPNRDLHGHDDIVRVAAPGEAVAGSPPHPSLHPDWPYPGAAWGMVIDLDLCTGCNACVSACQAENSVPSIGRSEIVLGRTLHWLTVDVYHQGEATHFQPRPCMHCEKAPCEVGCPVNATVHGPEGLNQMIYNRCIGTRTCASYCPYKVRRFNYHDYADAEPASYRMMRNPDLSVRTRGVMEKCTYCVQRIRRVQVQARNESRPIKDGEIVTACAQACPARAIHFGDLNDPAAQVTRLRADRRNYALLAELGTMPRTTYLAKIRGH